MAVITQAPYQPDPYLYAPRGWDNAYRAALSGAGSQYVPIYLIGDSLCKGGASTNFGAQSFWLQLISTLQSRYGNGGPGYRLFSETLDNSNNLYAFICDLAKPDGTNGYWTYPVGAWSITSRPYGVGGLCYHSATAGAQWVLRTSAADAATGLDLYAAKSSGAGAFSVSIDGTPYDANGVANGGGGNPTLNNAQTVGTAKVWSVSGLAAAAHTVTFTQVSGSVNVNGAMLYSASTHGVLPVRLARSGVSASLAFGNATDDSPTRTMSTLQQAPKLVILEYGLNDMQQNYAFAEYEQNMRRVVLAAKAAGSTVLILIPYMGIWAGWGNGWQANRYVEKAVRIGQDLACGVLNVHAAWTDLGKSALQNGAAGVTVNGNKYVTTYQTNPHPTNDGHTDLAARLVSVIG